MVRDGYVGSREKTTFGDGRTNLFDAANIAPFTNIKRKTMISEFCCYIMSDALRSTDGWWLTMPKLEVKRAGMAVTSDSGDGFFIPVCRTCLYNSAAKSLQRVQCLGPHEWVPSLRCGSGLCREKSAQELPRERAVLDVEHDIVIEPELKGPKMRKLVGACDTNAL